MKKSLFIFMMIAMAVIFSNVPKTFAQSDSTHKTEQEISHDTHAEGGEQDHEATAESHHHAAPGWSVIPFVLLLLMIATGPLFYEHFWHKNYPKVAVILAVLVVGYYIFALDNLHSPIHSLFEYIPFISLLAALFIASGGIAINVDKKSTAGVNAAILLVGAVIANIIGTTGASMLLIRPFIRLNKHRIRAYHIVFFIFVVSNVGGSLTPIGDPPLFLGFLKGVPFFWTLTHNVLPWIVASILLITFFYFLDKKMASKAPDEEGKTYTGKITITGQKNFLWLGVVIIAVFIDPNVFPWVPAIPYEGARISFIKEIIWIAVAYFSYTMASKKALETNEFSFEPIKEVAYIFIGIFGTMMPAIELVGAFAASPDGAKYITHNTLYWGTGALSGVLDNAPTYINFLTAGMAAKGADITVISDVVDFSKGLFPDSVLDLKAISVASVFFGAMTYIGNGPNFMVKSIAEEVGIKMPSFFGYIIRYSLPVLLPILFIIWLMFFAFV